MIECGGRRSDGKTPRNDFTFPRVHSICIVSNVLLKVFRNPSQIIDENRIVKFEIKFARDRFG